MKGRGSIKGPSSGNGHIEFPRNFFVKGGSSHIRTSRWGATVNDDLCRLAFIDFRCISTKTMKRGINNYLREKRIWKLKKRRAREKAQKETRTGHYRLLAEGFAQHCARLRRGQSHPISVFFSFRIKINLRERQREEQRGTELEVKSSTSRVMSGKEYSEINFMHLKQRGVNEKIAGSRCEGN
jgi:hypothetical protein